MIRLLAVEDSPTQAERLRSDLSAAGFAVTMATNAADALVLMQGEQFDLLLSDIVMPVMSGPDLAQRIVAGRPDIRVLYMSGFADQLNTAHGAMSAGVTILHKPFSPEKLVRSVRDCLDVAVS